VIYVGNGECVVGWGYFSRRRQAVYSLKELVPGPATFCPAGHDCSLREAMFFRVWYLLLFSELVVDPHDILAEVPADLQYHWFRTVQSFTRY
jgi:hypothetical protein